MQREAPGSMRSAAGATAFGQEAFGNDIEDAYQRALRRIAGEDITPQTATGFVVVRRAGETP